MKDVLITTAVDVVWTIAGTVVAIGFAYLTAKLGKIKGAEHIAEAVGEIQSASVLTAKELQQTMVDGLKAASADGKLTKEEVETIGLQLLAKTKEKLADKMIALVAAAGIDVDALIKGAAEAWIADGRRW